MDPVVTTVEAAVLRIRTEGFAVIENIIDSDRLARLSDDADGLLHPLSNQPGLNGTRVNGRMFKGLISASRAVDDLVVHPKITAVVAAVLAPKVGNGWAPGYAHDLRGIKLSTAMIKDVQPGEDIRAFHQDDGFYPLPRPRQPLVVNTLLAIDPFTEANGATRVVPRSHRWSKRLESDDAFEVVEMDPGSILMFDGAVWHGRGPNFTNDQCRRALNLYYGCAWLRQLEGHHCGLAEAEFQRLPEALQALL